MINKKDLHHATFPNLLISRELKALDGLYMSELTEIQRSFISNESSIDIYNGHVDVLKQRYIAMRNAIKKKFIEEKDVNNK